MEATTYRPPFSEAAALLHAANFNGTPDDMFELELMLTIENLPKDPSQLRARVNQIIQEWRTKQPTVVEPQPPASGTLVAKKEDLPPQHVTTQLQAPQQPSVVEQTPPLTTQARVKKASGGLFGNFSCACTAPQGARVGQTFRKPSKT